MDKLTLEKMAVTAFDNERKTRLSLFTAAEKTERRCRFEYDRAQVQVDTVKTLLRIAELTE